MHLGLNRIGTFTFHAGNLLAVDARVAVRVRPVRGEALRTLERIYRTEAVELSASAFSLQPVAAGNNAHQQRELTFEMRGGGRLLCQGLISTETLRTGQFSAAEVELTATPSEIDHGREPTYRDFTQERRGTYGVVVFADD